MKNFLIRFLLLACAGLILAAFGLFSMWKTSQQALECSTYVRDGIDLTGRGRNNCTSPELIP